MSTPTEAEAHDRWMARLAVLIRLRRLRRMAPWRRRGLLIGTRGLR